MDFNSLASYASTLGMLYGWTLLAAGVFAIGEMIAHRAFSRQAAPPGADRPAS
jgi:hypothetical protein